MTTATQNNSAIVQLYRDIASYFETLGTGTAVVFGIKERWKQINEGTLGANRVVFVPGSIPDGKDGILEGTTGPGEIVGADGVVKARALFDQKKVVTVCIWAADPSNPDGTDAIAQQEVLEQLFEQTLQGIKRSLAGAANAISITPPTYNANPNEQRFGLEYRLELAIETRLLDRVPVARFPKSAGVTRQPGLV